MYARLTRSTLAALLLLSSQTALAQEDLNLNEAAPPAQSQPAPPAPINNAADNNATSNSAAPNGDMLQAVAQAIENLRTSSNQNFSALSTRLDQMEKKLITREQLNEALQGEMEAAASRFAAKTDLDNYVPRTEFNELQRQFTELQDSFNDQAAQINQFRQQMGEQVTTLNDQAQQLRQVVNAISRTDSQQRPILDINSSMQSQEFQRDLSGAMHNTMQREGVLEVSNQMTTAQYLRVNGQLLTIPPLNNASIRVPVGTLTTELLGEAPKNWTISPPQYKQGIIIAPRQSTTVVASPVVVYSPF